MRARWPGSARSTRSRAEAPTRWPPLDVRSILRRLHRERGNEAHVLRLFGDLACQLEGGDVGDAEDHYRKALALTRSSGCAPRRALSSWSGATVPSKRPSGARRRAPRPGERALPRDGHAALAGSDRRRQGGSVNASEKEQAWPTTWSNSRTRRSLGIHAKAATEPPGGRAAGRGAPGWAHRGQVVCVRRDYVVAILQMPDNVRAAAFSVAVSAGRAVRAFKTTPLLTMEESMQVMKSAGGAKYRSPIG